MNHIERLYEEYKTADRKDKPGLSRALDLIAGYGYVEKREALAQTVKDSLIKYHSLDTTADLADCVAADIIERQWRI